MLKKAKLYKKIKGKTVQCQNCSHYCVLKDGETGICGVKKNINGTLYNLRYGKICALGIDPIEKKPFFHFLPGTFSLSLASAGCNFKCWSCQNWQISQISELPNNFEEQEISPRQIVSIAKENNLPSISYTYTEPTIFSDYAIEVMKLARAEGIKNCWVSNGFWSKELFSLIAPYLDAANIDLKSFDDDFYRKYTGGRLKPVLDNLQRLKEKNIWTEVTTLIIPGLNDSEETFKRIAEFVKKKLGAETPWHLSRFFGDVSWKLKNFPETPLATLEKAYEIGKSAGLKYVYIGNTDDSEKETTFCPKCGEKVIERIGYKIIRHDKDGKCPKCGEPINIIE